jgi:hypothetical protein
MATKIKRSQVKMFLNTTPQSTATYKIIGDGVTNAKIAYNPKTTEETYVTQDSASISIDSYAPNVPVEASAKYGDDVFNYIDGLRIARAVLSAAETDVVNVWAYKSGGPSAYPAEKQTCSIQIDDFGGEGGVAAKINYTINYLGDPIVGTFNTGTSVFTPS